MHREKSIFMKIIQDLKYILYLLKMQMHISKKNAGIQCIFKILILL